MAAPSSHATQQAERLLALERCACALLTKLSALRQALRRARVEAAPAAGAAAGAPPLRLPPPRLAAALSQAFPEDPGALMGPGGALERADADGLAQTVGRAALLLEELEPWHTALAECAAFHEEAVRCVNDVGRSALELDPQRNPDLARLFLGAVTHLGKLSLVARSIAPECVLVVQAHALCHAARGLARSGQPLEGDSHPQRVAAVRLCELAREPLPQLQAALESVSVRVGEALDATAARTLPVLLASAALPKQRPVGRQRLALFDASDVSARLSVPRQPTGMRQLDEHTDWALYGLLLCPAELQHPDLLRLLEAALRDSFCHCAHRDVAVHLFDAFALHAVAKLERGNAARREVAQALTKALVSAWAAATAESTAAHTAERVRLCHDLRQALAVLSDSPGLLGPQAHAVCELLAAAKHELEWVARHAAATSGALPIPRARSQAFAGKAAQAAVAVDRTAAELLALAIALRRLFERYAPTAAAYALRVLDVSLERRVRPLVAKALAAVTSASENAIERLLASLPMDLEEVVGTANALAASEEHEATRLVQRHGVVERFRLNWLRAQSLLSASGAQTTLRKLAADTAGGREESGGLGDNLVAELVALEPWARMAGAPQDEMRAAGGLGALQFFPSQLQAVAKMASSEPTVAPWQASLLDGMLGVYAAFAEEGDEAVPADAAALALAGDRCTRALLDDVRRVLRETLVKEAGPSCRSGLEQQLCRVAAAQREAAEGSSGDAGEGDSGDQKTPVRRRARKSVVEDGPRPLPGFESAAGNERQIAPLATAAQRAARLAAACRDALPAPVGDEALVPRAFARAALKRVATEATRAGDGPLANAVTQTLHANAFHLGAADEAAACLGEAILAEAYCGEALLDRAAAPKVASSKPPLAAARVSAMADIVAGKAGQGSKPAPRMGGFSGLPQDAELSHSSVRSFPKTSGGFGLLQADRVLGSTMAAAVPLLAQCLSKNSAKLAPIRALDEEGRGGAPAWSGTVLLEKLRKLKGGDSVVQALMVAGRALGVREMLARSAAPVASESCPAALDAVALIAQGCTGAAPAAPRPVRTMVRTAQLYGARLPNLPPRGAGDLTLVSLCSGAIAEQKLGQHWGYLPELCATLLLSRAWEGAAWDPIAGGFSNGMHAACDAAMALVAAFEVASARAEGADEAAIPQAAAEAVARLLRYVAALGACEGATKGGLVTPAARAKAIAVEHMRRRAGEYAPAAAEAASGNASAEMRVAAARERSAVMRVFRGQP